MKIPAMGIHPIYTMVYFYVSKYEHDASITHTEQVIKTIVYLNFMK